MYTYDTGWRRPAGCLELQVIFRKRATNYRARLRKMTYTYDHRPSMYTYDTGKPRPIGCHFFIGHFPQKSPTISGSFAENEVQLIRHHMYTRDTGWQKPIGCLKLQVIFRKRAIYYGALLRKITYEDKASYGSSPPCNICPIGHIWNAQHPI